MKKKRKFKSAYSKQNVQHNKDRMKQIINNATPAETEGLKKAFEYYENVFKKNDWDEEDHCLFRLIHYRLKRMQKALKSSEYYWYEEYGISLDRAIRVIDIFIKDDLYYDGYVNTRNAYRFFPKVSEEMLNSMFDKNQKQEAGGVLSKVKVDMYKARCSDLRKEKAFHLFMFIMENFSRHWWL